MGKNIQVKQTDERSQAGAEAPESAKALAAQALADAGERALDPVERVKRTILARAKRGSRVGAPGDKLATRPVPGFHLHWVSKQQPNAIENRIAQGYVFVNRESGLPTDLPDVPSQGLGSAAERADLVLMATPEELRDERLAETQKRVDRNERAMKRHLAVEANRNNSTGIPVPLEGSIRIEREVRVID